MPEIKANEPLPERPVFVVIFGDPGIGKTSLFNTAADPYLLDFDRGVSRSINRQDTLAPDNWEEVLEFEKKGRFKQCSTLGIDTAKACLDDFLMSYVVKKDYKNQKNKQAAYGALGDEFKIFVNNRRCDGVDVVVLAHSKDKEDGDLTKKIADVTGGSYQLLMRIADQIGFMTMRNGKRVIQWDPTDFSVGKNVARLPVIEVPDESDPAFKTFLADIIRHVRQAIVSLSEAQREAEKKSADFQARIAACESPDCLTDLLTESKSLPDHLRVPLTKLIADKAKEKGYVANKDTKRFEDPAPAAGAAPSPGATTTPPAPVAASQSPSIPVGDPAAICTPTEDRYIALENAGLTLELDGARGYGIAFPYETVNEWPEEAYMKALGQIEDQKKSHNKNGTVKKSRQAAAVR